MSLSLLAKRLPSVEANEERVAVVRPEETVAAIWAEVLGVPCVDWDEDIRRLDPSTAAANQILVLLRERYGSRLDLTEFWKAGTIRKVCGLLERTSKPAPATPLLQIPFARNIESATQYREAHYTFTLPADLCAAADRLAAEASCSRGDLLLAVFEAVLYRYTGSDEITLALALGFDPAAPLVSFRNHFGGEPNFRELLRRVVEAQTVAIDGGDTWIEAVRLPIIYHYEHRVPVSFGHHDLGLNFREIDNVVTGRLSYHAARFDAFHIERMAGHLLTLLRSACAHPDRSIAQIPLLADDEFKQIVHEWNATSGTYPHDSLLQDGFDARVMSQPDAVAVVAGGKEFTYRQINERANRLAHYLKGQGVEAGAFVGICLKRSEHMIVSVLTALKLGAAYSPMDASYPKDRLAYMLEQTKAPVVITQTEMLERLPEGGSRFLCLDRLENEIASQSGDDLPRVQKPDQLAYVIFTSGSTGKPKGVILRHQPVVNTINWVNETYEVRPSDRLLFVASLSFDMSVYDIFGTLAAGASIRVATEEELRDPARLLGIMRIEPITIWDSAPPTLAQLVPFFGTRHANPNSEFRIPKLRLVMLSGDWIPVPLPDQVRNAFPSAQLFAMGGATEGSIWTNWYPIGLVDPRWSSIPYGKPIRKCPLPRT